MKNRFHTLIAMAVLIAGTACTQAEKEKDQQAGAEGQQQQAGGQQAQAPSGAQDFLKTVAAEHQFEIQAAQLAQQKSTNRSVTQFASSMVKDHTQLLNDTQKVAQQYNVQISTDLPQKHQNSLDKLQSASGTEFDQTYVQTMVSNHQEDIRMLNNHIQAADFAPTRDLAQAALPMIRKHYEMAQDLQQSVQMRAPASVPESESDTSSSGHMDSSGSDASGSGQMGSGSEE
jgi:putative membrane protein